MTDLLIIIIICFCGIFSLKVLYDIAFSHKVKKYFAKKLLKKLNIDSLLTKESISGRYFYITYNGTKIIEKADLSKKFRIYRFHNDVRIYNKKNIKDTLKYYFTHCVDKTDLRAKMILSLLNEL